MASSSRQPRKWTPLEDQKLREEVEAQSKKRELLLFCFEHFIPQNSPLTAIQYLQVAMSKTGMMLREASTNKGSALLTSPGVKLPIGYQVERTKTVESDGIIQ